MTAGMPGAPVEVRAPGKLFIAGEYAVVEPGQPAVLVALDRFVTVRLTGTTDVGTIAPADADDSDSPPLPWSIGPDGVTAARDEPRYAYVLAVLDLVDRLRVERGIAPRHADVRVASELDDDASGRKFGLGSSAAVTVATVGALDAFLGLGLSRRERFCLALLATVTVAPSASGGDLAASTWGGWIRYSAPDRARLRAMLPDTAVADLLRAGDHWDGFSVTPLTPSGDLGLLVGWTGSPASTAGLVDVVERHRRGAAGGHATFTAASRAAVDDLVTGLQSDAPLALDAVHRARGLLRGLGDAVGVAIETDQLGVLCDTADAAGAAGKPSGAGGGDCGIVLVPRGVDPDAIVRAWAAHDIRHLTVSVHPQGSPVDDH